MGKYGAVSHNQEAPLKRAYNAAHELKRWVDAETEFPRQQCFQREATYVLEHLHYGVKVKKPKETIDNTRRCGRNEAGQTKHFVRPASSSPRLSSLFVVSSNMLTDMTQLQTRTVNDKWEILSECVCFFEKLLYVRVFLQHTGMTYGCFSRPKHPLASLSVHHATWRHFTQFGIKQQTRVMAPSFPHGTRC